MGLDFCLVEKSGRKKDGALDLSSVYLGGAVEGRFVERAEQATLATSSSMNLTRFSTLYIRLFIQPILRKSEFLAVLDKESLFYLIGF